MAARRNVEAIATSPVVRQVGWLDLSGEKLQTRGWRQLAGSANLNALTGLVLRECKLGQDELKEVLRASDWRGLRHLDLTENKLDGDALGELLAWPGLQRLHSLSLGGNRIGDAELSLLAHSARPGQPGGPQFDLPRLQRPRGIRPGRDSLAAPLPRAPFSAAAGGSPALLPTRALDKHGQTGLGPA